MATPVSRRDVVLGALAASSALAAEGGGAAPVSVEEQSLAALSEALARGAVSSVALVEAYGARIARLNPTLLAVLEVNPEALALARALDEERAQGRVRGPLHGVPVLVKDNLDTADLMKTTAGSLALLDAPTPARDATVVQRLRDAGCVLLGKTNLSEWANLRGQASVSGWSARGGQTRNPYVLDRNPSGSSSGSGAAVAASLAAAAIGTETDGSIVSPACSCGLVGFKPTLGLVSRAGIIPISHTQDTAGPMARSVRDAALVLQAIAGPDPLDAATQVKHPPLGDLVAGLGQVSLEGARLGLVTSLVGRHLKVGALTRKVVQALQAAGAVVVEVDLHTQPYEDAELEVLVCELKADLDAYLAARGGPMKDVAAVVAFNQAHAAQELAYFGQEYLEQAVAKGPLSAPSYRRALATCQKAREGLEAPMAKHRLDALVGPTGSPAWPIDPVNGDAFGFSASTAPAVAGWPHLTVPMGFVGQLPVGFSFIGRPWTDGKVLALGQAFETLTQARRPPRYLPTV